MSLHSVLGLIAQELEELLIEEHKLLYGVKDEVKHLQMKLSMIAAFIHDIGSVELDARAKTLLSETRKLAYDAKDLIESHIIEVRDSKEEGFIKRYACFCGSTSRTRTLASKIKAIMAMIDETMEPWYLGLSEKRIFYQGVERTRFKAYPHNYEEHVVGLEEDITKLAGVLTANETQTNVVLIVGMCGSGKTTVSRKLCNHKSVKSHFDCLAWVTISSSWSANEILLDLLKEASGQTMCIDEISRERVQCRLYQHLESKRYLVVLDDVWGMEALKVLLLAFPYANGCMKIIVTTRKQYLTDFSIFKCINHEMGRLREEESWELFRKIAFIHWEESSNFVDMSLFEALGKEMLKKCEGLALAVVALAVVALAGILSEEKTLETWEKIKKSVSSRIMEEGRGTDLYGPVNKMLALSYHQLPAELQSCFLYLSNFPEDCEIDVELLIQMWIVEAFVKSYKLHEGDTLEDVARWYLDELIHWHMVQIVEKNNDGMVESIRMHDLVRDFCIKTAEEQDFVAIFTSKAPNSYARVIQSS